MAKTGNNQNNTPKPIISAEVTPFEKEAYKRWWQGKYASEADAIRSHIRKVINYDPESQAESQANSEKSPSDSPAGHNGG